MGRYTKYFWSFVALIVSGGYSYYHWSELRAEEQQKLKELLSLEANIIERTIDVRFHGSMQALERMAKRWTHTGGTEESAWRSDSASYINDSSAITTIEWVDNTYHVRLIEPLAGNEKILGLNIKFDKEREEILSSSAVLKQTTLTPPLDLVQGYRAVISYCPVYSKNVFDGFIVGIHRLDKLFSEGLPLLDRNLLQIRVSDQGKVIYDSIISGATVPELREWRTLEFYDRSWDLSLEPTKAFVELYRQNLTDTFAVQACVISLLFAVAVYLVGGAEEKSLFLEAKSKDLANAIKKYELLNSSLEAQKSSLETSVSELERLNVMMVGREKQMMELKVEINSLSAELGRELPYPRQNSAGGFDLNNGPANLKE